MLSLSIPVFSQQEVVGVLDVDSEILGFFDATDERFLKDIVDLLKIK